MQPGFATATSLSFVSVVTKLHSSRAPRLHADHACALFSFLFSSLSLSLSHGTRSSQSIIIAERLSTLLCTYDNRTVCPNCVVRYFQKAKLAYLLHAYSTRTRRYFFFCHLFSSSDVMRCEFLGG